MSTSNSGLGLAILSTAVGATLAGPAEAALISMAGSGFTPVTVTATSGSYSFDVDGNGTLDFTLTGNGTNIVLKYLSATSGAQTFAGFLNSAPSASALAFGSVKSGSTSATINANFATLPAQYAGLVTNGTFNASNIATAGTLDYLQGTFNNTATPSFQLLDFGVVTNPTTVPEPASLALLATGAAGIAALRRRRASATARATAA